MVGEGWFRQTHHAEYGSLCRVVSLRCCVLFLWETVSKMDGQILGAFSLAPSWCYQSILVALDVAIPLGRSQARSQASKVQIHSMCEALVL